MLSDGVYCHLPGIAYFARRGDFSCRGSLSHPDPIRPVPTSAVWNWGGMGSIQGAVLCLWVDFLAFDVETVFCIPGRLLSIRWVICRLKQSCLLPFYLGTDLCRARGRWNGFKKTISGGRRSYELFVIRCFLTIG
jgi:hypothetical protein